MAQNVEPMDIDSSVCDFDNKENTHSNVLPRTPCTEKGYEELDVSELNMKLRYSVTPASSPMSKSFTANCLDNKNLDPAIAINSNENEILTQSLNSTVTRNDSAIRTQKLLPLQALQTDQFVDNNRNALRPLDAVVDSNIQVTVSTPNEIDENLSSPSSLSSMTHTPEATTPTKEISKSEGGSPIMRGLKSMFSMFRPSQSPIPPTENESHVKQETLGPPVIISPESTNSRPQVVVASTPLTGNKNNVPKTSPNRDSIIFNDDLENELQWKDDTTIYFSKEKIPVHKLFFQQGKPLDLPGQSKNVTEVLQQNEDVKLETTLEYMDISYNDSAVQDNTLTEMDNVLNKNEANVATESDSEFLDCESFIKNESLAEYSLKSQDELETKDVLVEVECVKENKDVCITQESQEATLLVKPSDLSIIPTKTTIGDGITELVSETAEYVIKGQEEFVGVNNENDVSLTSCQPNFPVEILLNQPTSFEHNSVNLAENVSTSTISDSILTSCPPSLPDNHLSNLPIALEDNFVDVTQDVSISILSKDDVKLNVFPESNSNAITELSNIRQSELQVPIVNVDAIPTLENIVISSLSNIPLISDPRVLLFNIPEIAADDQQLQQNETALNTLPSDVPLPDDEDIEKIISLPTDVPHEITLFNNTSSNIEMSEINVVYNSGVKLTENIVDDDQLSKLTEIMQSHITQDTTLSENINVSPLVNNNKENESECVSVPGNEIISNELITEQINFNESINDINVCSNSEQIGVSTTFVVEQNIANSNSSIPDVEAMPFKDTNTTPALLKTDDAVATEHDIYETKQEKELEQKTTESTSEILVSEPNQMLIDGAHTAERILEENAGILKGTHEIDSVLLQTDQGKDKLVAQASQVDLPIEKQTLEMIDTTQSEAMDVSTMKFSDEVMNRKDCVIPQELEITKTVDTSQSINFNKSKESNIANLSDTMVIFPNNKLKDSSVVDDNIVEPNNDFIGNENKMDSEINKQLQPDTPLINITATIQIVPSILSDKNISDTIDDTNIELTEDATQSDTLIKEEPVNTISSVEIIENVNFKDESVREEEIIASENSSPFVSVTADLELFPETMPIENAKEIDNQLTAKTKLTPPSSPKIVSKGYNFNFDEIDDPFATKTKIRMSPPLVTSPNKSFERDSSAGITESSETTMNKIRRKSQPARKKPVIVKKLNSTFNGSLNAKVDMHNDSTSNLQEAVIVKDKVESKDKLKSHEKIVSDETSLSTVVLQNNQETNSETTCDNTNAKLSEDTSKNESLNIAKDVQCDNMPIGSVDKPIDVILSEKSLIECDTQLNETKIISSEQSTYYSAGASSTEGIESKSVFNLPEIDDATFNPFAKKSKIRQSPPPSLGIDNTLASKSKNELSPEVSTIAGICASSPINFDGAKTVINNNTEEKLDTAVEEKNSSVNISNTSDDKDVTVREVHTEDEDTVEGPFLGAEDLNLTDDKIPDIDPENMMQFTDLRPQVNEENTDGGELFIDAEAFEFLLNQNKDNVVADSGKESLFLKFDPLFAKRLSSDGVVAALRKVQKRQSTPKKAPVPQKDATFMKKSPVAGSSTLNVAPDVNVNINNESNDDFNITVTKPMMVVTPAVNPVVMPRNKIMTPSCVNRRSLTFTSPAIAVIDRLLSMSANNSFADHDSTVNEVAREQNEADLALTQLREMLADKEINVYNLRSESKELKDRLASLESQVKSLESISEERLKKINELNEKLSEKTNTNKRMATVVEEYERTIASLIAETEQDKKRNAEERVQLIKERDEQTAHLTSMEVSFSDLHSKYEKSKQVILGFKANEESYKKSIKEFEENLTKMQNNYELLKQHATSKLNHANDELQKMNRAHDAEVLKLNAMIKRKELHITSLEETLLQKTKANEELTAICDELINKVG